MERRGILLQIANQANAMTSCSAVAAVAVTASQEIVVEQEEEEHQQLLLRRRLKTSLGINPTQLQQQRVPA